MTLQSRVGAALSRTFDPAVTAFAAHLAEERDDVLAVLFYGSNLRTGSREGVLDFYLLTDGAPETGLWPRVSYRERDFEGETLRAKIATMTMAKFAEAARGDTIDTTIWARFVQPSGLVWQRDDAAAQLVQQAIESAACTAARLAVAVGPAAGPEDAFWTALFRATYKAELRVEKPGREQSILSLNAAHFAGLLPAALEAAQVPFARDGEQIIPQMPAAERKRVLRWWNKRRRRGKLLNLARLARATRTFDGAASYAAWKIERHTGKRIEVTPFREKHPFLAAPGVLWTVWRAKRS